MTRNKRPLAVVARDDDAAANFSNTNNASNFSLLSLTLPSPKKPRLAAPWDDSHGRNQMSSCTNRESPPASMRSAMDTDPTNGEPCGDPTVCVPSIAPLLPYRPALMPTPEPEGDAEGLDARPRLLLSNNLGLTPPPTIPSPVHSSSAKNLAQEHRDTTPAESAGARFWELLHTRHMEGHLERFFIDIFEIKPAMGGNINSDVIWPYYRQGMLAGFIRTGEDLVVKEDNIGINIAAMQVSKEFQEAGSRLVYGAYAFAFNDPANCKWWCKHIGELNLSKMHTLIIEMDCGWPHVWSLNEVCSLDQSAEELWHSFLFWFKTRHQLHTIVINFDYWKEVRKIAPRDSNLREQLDHWRERIGSVLFGYRGLKRAVLRDSYGLGLGGERDVYSMMMLQDRASVFPPTPKRKMTFAQYFAERQNLLRMKAALEEDERRKEKQRRKEQKGYGRKNGYALLKPQDDEAEDQDTEMGGFRA